MLDGQLNLSVKVWDYKPVLEKVITALLDRANPLENFSEL